MTHEQLQQIRDALAYYGHSSVSRPATTEALSVLDAELAKPEQEPVGCKHFRYSVDVHEQTGTCYDCGAEGRMRFVVDAPAPLNQYDQTALELCEVCGWKTLIPGDCCLNCERGKVEQEPVAWIHPDIAQRLINGEMVGTILGMDKSSHRTFPLYTHPMPETAAPHARDAVAWMPDTGYVFAPDKNTAPVPAPQREWQGLTKDEINDCAGAEIYSSTWAMAFAIGIEQTLRRKNTCPAA